MLGDLGLPAGHEYMSFVETEWQGAPLVVCRTGYTGERGLRAAARAGTTPAALWDALLEAAAARGGRAAGLGARDTLRTEMGYALHGHELSLDITPVQARVGWAVGWKKDGLLGPRGAASPRRRPARGGCSGGCRRSTAACRAPTSTWSTTAARVVGRTTSGTFSPTLKQGIALALLPPEAAADDELNVDVRGRRLRCRVVRPPFVQVQTREG